ncbi:hypothetical protein [Streptomyces sclerotialus]|uniref:hypothetical protein n=1 Tax=Streptomyces sclerotialus TaxID=1957 RepID=UPI0004CAAB58
MRCSKRALIGLTCVFALVPAGSAMAGTGPAPAPPERSVAKSTAPSAAGNPVSARAKAAGVCSDAYAIGETGYIVRQGVKIASVKQFYSPKCRQNYGYLWVWDSFRATAGDYDVSTAVYSYSQDEILGTRAWTNNNDQEFWSNGTDTVNDCTAGVGSLRKAGDPVSAQAAGSKRC